MHYQEDPKEYVLDYNGDKPLRDNVEMLYEQSAGKEVEYKNSLYIRRSPYEIISVMDEGKSADPYIIKGKLIDLFDPNLPVGVARKM